MRRRMPTVQRLSTPCARSCSEPCAGQAPPRSDFPPNVPESGAETSCPAGARRDRTSARQPARAAKFGASVGVRRPIRWISSVEIPWRRLVISTMRKRMRRRTCPAAGARNRVLKARHVRIDWTSSYTMPTIDGFAPPRPHPETFARPQISLVEFYEQVGIIQMILCPDWV